MYYFSKSTAFNRKIIKIQSRELVILFLHTGNKLRLCDVIQPKTPVLHSFQLVMPITVLFLTDFNLVYGRLHGLKRACT